MMASAFVKVVVFVSVVALLVLASGCLLPSGEKNGVSGSSDRSLALPDKSMASDPPPPLPPSEEDSLPPLPEGK